MPKHQEYRGDRKDRRATVDKPTVPMHTCPGCGKQAYQSRRDAKMMAKRLHQGKKTRLHQCRSRNTRENWHVTTMGAWATMAYKDWEANGRRPLATIEEPPNYLPLNI